jgi:hypothetical protein
MFSLYSKMSECRNALTEKLRRFARNERGESNAMSNIMILAIAAMIVAGLYFFGQKIWDFLTSFWEQGPAQADPNNNPFKN